VKTEKEKEKGAKQRLGVKLASPSSFGPSTLEMSLDKVSVLELNYYTNISDSSHRDKPMYYNDLPQKQPIIFHAVFPGLLRFFMQFLAVLAYLFYTWSRVFAHFTDLFYILLFHTESSFRVETCLSYYIHIYETVAYIPG